MSVSLAVGAMMPALAMTAVRGPRAFVAASNIATASASTETSPLSATARPPPLAIVSTTASAAFVLAIVDADRPSVLGGEPCAGAADAARTAGDE
jgi:hypothetical protein